MQNVIAWTKANPISLTSIVVAIVAIGVLAWVHVNGNAFTKRMLEQQGNLTQIERAMNQRVQVPGKTPTEPPRDVFPITVNQAAIDQLEAVYAKMGGEYKQVFDEARKINRPGHAPMSPNLFPVSQSAAAFGAKDDYPRALRAMLGPPSPDSPLPALNAKPPIDSARINEELERIEQQYRVENSIGAGGGFEHDQFEELRRRKSAALREMLINHARTLNIYAHTQPDHEQFPFHVPDWVKLPGTPNEVALWTGQMMLWIQQDIVAAIALANGVGEPGRDVTDSVVKRLLSVRVVPGAVGVRNRGGLMTRLGESSQFTDAGFTPPAADAPPPTAPSADTRLPDDFSVAPTGRSSNALYDVWHVWVEIVADSQQLPEFFNALSQVNFMTVLTVEASNVNEYDALHQGFVYGQCDTVHLKLLVETIWIRDWTTRLMPATVKQLLGIVPQEDAAAR